jgi:hypothetical protein
VEFQNVEMKYFFPKIKTCFQGEISKCINKMDFSKIKASKPPKRRVGRLTPLRKPLNCTCSLEASNPLFVFQWEFGSHFVAL